MKNTILIVDDEELNRELLKQMFESEYTIITADNGKDAIVEIGKHMDDIAIILLDIMLPILNGYQVLQALNAKKILEKIPVILITAHDDSQTESYCYSMGATAIISKPFQVQSTRKRVISTIELYNNMNLLESTVQNQKEQLYKQQHKLEVFYDGLIDAVSNIVEFRNMQFSRHISEVKEITRILATTYAKLYPEANISHEQILTIVRASATHDIGKITVPDSILMKPGKLTEEEHQLIKSHTTKGCEILAMLSNVQNHELYTCAYEACRYHHEKYDGSGYPEGLKGDDIPLAAQFVAMADVYDALRSERVYKQAYDKDKAYDIIMHEEQGAFSEQLLKCFDSARNSIEQIMG